ncbi:MAG: TonB-dependent receptor [Gammaproteobacteria bacterium]
MNLRPVVYLSMTCLAADPAHGQEGEPAHEDALERMTVTATALGTHAEDLPIPVSVMDGDELVLKSGTGSLGEVLAGEPGITGSYFGPVSSRPIIRGQAGPRVRILQDRIGALDVSAISPDHAVSIEPLFARRIEILRGPATLLYGGGAEGGVVNTVTNRVPVYDPLGLIEGAVELRTDSASGEEAGLAMLEGRVGSFNWHVEGVSRETDDVEINGPAERPGLHEDEEHAGEEEEVPEGIIPNSDSDSWSYSTGVAWTGDAGHLGVGYTRYRSRYGLPGESHGHEGEEGAEPEPEIFDGARIFMDQERWDFKSEWRPSSGAIEALRLDAGISDYTHREVEPSGETGTVFDDESTEARFEALHSLGEWNGVAGLQYLSREFSAVGEEAYLPLVETTKWGAFLLEERHFGKLTFSAGARLEQMEHDPASAAPAYDDTAFSGSAGFVRPFGGAVVSLNLNYTERHPAPEELYSEGPHLATGLYEIGDAGLGREKNRSVDLGIRGGEAWSWSVNLFYKDAGDYIYLAGTGEIEDELPVAEYRQADATFYGYEVEARVPLWHLEGGHELHALLWSDMTRGTLDGVSGNRNIPRMPVQRLAAGLEWATVAWSAAVEAVYHDDQQHTADFESETSAYTLVNADFVYSLDFGRARTLLFVRGKNLLDVDGRRSVSFLKDSAPIPGRSLEAGVRVGF